jgi:phasin family protein
MTSADDKPKVVKTPVKPKTPATARVAKPKPVAKPEPEPAPPVAAKIVAPAPIAVAAPVETPAAPPAVTEKKIEAPKIESVTETQTAAAIPAPVTQKDVFTMEPTIKAVTEKTQAAFAEFNDRAKTAVEKSTKLFEEANEFGKGNVEALVESSKIAAKGMETLGQDAAAFARKSFEDSSAALKSFAAAKSPTDFFKLHSDYVRGAFDAAVAESAKSTEAFLKLASEIAQPISNRFAVAAEKAKIAA